jgi:hypothetical protein
VQFRELARNRKGKREDIGDWAHITKRMQEEALATLYLIAENTFPWFM